MKQTHVAIIPARKGSTGLPFKNRMLFDYTAYFIEREGFFDSIIVSTNDEIVTEKAMQRGYTIHRRSEELAGDDVSMKRVFKAVIVDFRIPDDHILWIFSLPVLYKNISDFIEAKKIIESGIVRSLCGFIPAKSHPFYCWSYEPKSRELRQYIANDVFRRQDLPPAWTPHNYLQCFRAGEIDALNSEMLNSNTYPFFLNQKAIDNIIEIDTPEELEQWEKMTGKRIERWK